MKIVISILFLMLLYSCDPMRRIYIKNDSNEEAWITYIIKEDSIKSSPLFISNNPEVKLYLKGRTSNVINMSFGIGNWDEQSLKEFVDDLESMEIKSYTGILKMNNPDSIQNFLSNHRTGLGNRVIKIRFTDQKPVKSLAHIPG